MLPADPETATPVWCLPHGPDSGQHHGQQIQSQSLEFTCGHRLWLCPLVQHRSALVLHTSYARDILMSLHFAVALFETYSHRFTTFAPFRTCFCVADSRLQGKHQLHTGVNEFQHVYVWGAGDSSGFRNVKDVAPRGATMLYSSPEQLLEGLQKGFGSTWCC